MAAGGFVNICRFNAASSGTGDFVVSSAVTGYQTPADAGAVNATVYSYRAESADLTQWEIGEGAYTSGTTTLARTTVHESSNAGAAVNFSAAPQVAIVALAGDLLVSPGTFTDNAAVRADSTAGKTQNSALLIADTTGALSRSGGGGIGVEASNSNTNPGAAEVGNYQSSEILAGSAVAAASGTAVDITSLSLGAGNWLIWGNAAVITDTGTATAVNVWVNTTSATEPTRPNSGGQQFAQGISMPAASEFILSTGMKRISQAGTATHYLTVRQTGSTGSPTAYGFLGAIRLP